MGTPRSKKTKAAKVDAVALQAAQICGYPGARKRLRALKLEPKMVPGTYLAPSFGTAPKSLARWQEAGCPYQRQGKATIYDPAAVFDWLVHKGQAVQKGRSKEPLGATTLRAWHALDPKLCIHALRATLELYEKLSDDSTRRRERRETRRLMRSLLEKVTPKREEAAKKLMQELAPIEDPDGIEDVWEFEERMVPHDMLRALTSFEKIHPILWAYWTMINALEELEFPFKDEAECDAELRWAMYDSVLQKVLGKKMPRRPKPAPTKRYRIAKFERYHGRYPDFDHTQTYKVFDVVSKKAVKSFRKSTDPKLAQDDFSSISLARDGKVVILRKGKEKQRVPLP